ncbi:unnamed protein product [Gemmataceae bacterium]|nr:unnamed protein product [Gemmataceae bacterium]VTT98772.1 unnamed protein product [Gemmataceae bacterium]
MSLKVTIPAASLVVLSPTPPGLESVNVPTDTLGTAANCWANSVTFPRGGPWEEVSAVRTPTGGYTVEYRLVAPSTRLTREELIAAYIMKHQDDPDSISVRKIEKATGIPKSEVGRSPAWEAFAAWRETGKVGEVRMRQLTDAILLNLPDRSPINDVADTLETLIASQKIDSADDSYPPQYDDDADDRG